MYEDFYGLRERPFTLTSNLKYLLLTPKHEEALSNLEYGISTNAGITLLLGQAGMGKTTLLRKVRASCMQRSSVNSTSEATIGSVRWVLLNNPVLKPGEFFDTLAHALELSPDCASCKSRFLRELEEVLLEQRENGVFSVLVIDEAQGLSDALLEEIRLLTNIERETEKLLRVVLAGQPALGERLNEPAFRQLKQRIALRCVLPPLDLHETAAYIAHRISLAGGSPARVFSREAIIAIYERSHGIPRTINVLCENALLTGFAADEQPVGSDIVLEVCQDFDFEAPTGPLATRSHASEAPHGQKVSTSAPASVATGGAVASIAAASRRFSFAQFARRRR
jgi:general secretion pathway protein A